MEITAKEYKSNNNELFGENEAQSESDRIQAMQSSKTSSSSRKD